MKKRVLIVLGLIVLLVAVCLLPAGATNTTTEDIDFSSGGTVRGYCQQCKTNVDWLPFTQEVSDTWGNDYNPANGTHYYVCYTTEGQTRVKVASGSGLAIDTGEELCLHLNGKRILRDGARAFGISGTLSIFDHAANEGKVDAYASTSSTGCVVRLNASGAKFNLYGGQLVMKTGSSAYAKNGGDVYCVGGTTFTMYGGTLTGGIAGMGGNLYVETNASAFLLGGSITGGVASNGNNYGGNVYCNGKLTLGNCSVTGGTADLGDDIYLTGDAKLTVTKEFAGEATVTMNDAHLPADLSNGYLTETMDACEGPFSGKLYLEKSGVLYQAVCERCGA